MPLTHSLLLDSIIGLESGFTNNTLTREEAAALDLETATAKQVHRAELAWVERREKKERDADAVATFTPGLAVGVYSADCTPVLVAAVAGGAFGGGEVGRAFGALAIHGGWRGTAQGISGKAFREFAAAALVAQPSARFVAAVGPCISFESFEVGEEVAREFPPAATRFLRLEGDRKKFLVDLPGENGRQLREAATELGVSLEVEQLGLCTLKLDGLFPSYRRNGANAGRILSFLRFTPGKGVVESQHT